MHAEMRGAPFADHRADLDVLGAGGGLLAPQGRRP